MADITFEDAIGEDTQDALAPGRNRERGPHQVALDKIVEAQVKAWEAAGKPLPTEKDGKLTPNPESPTERRMVKADDRGAFKGMVRRAANLHKTDPIYYADGKETNGKVAVKWTVGPRKATTKASGNEEAAPATPPATPPETPPAPPAQEQESQQRGRFGGRR